MKLCKIRAAAASRKQVALGPKLSKLLAHGGGLPCCTFTTNADRGQRRGDELES